MKYYTINYGDDYLDQDSITVKANSFAEAIENSNIDEEEIFSISVER